MPKETMRDLIIAMRQDLKNLKEEFSEFKNTEMPKYYKKADDACERSIRNEENIKGLGKLAAGVSAVISTVIAGFVFIWNMIRG